MTQRIAQGRLRLVLVVMNSQLAGELCLEMAHRAQTWRAGTEVVECALEKIVQSEVRMLGLDRGFHQLTTIGRQQGRVVMETQSLAPMTYRDLSQDMQVALAGAAKRDFSTKKQVQLACEWALRPAGTLRHGFHQSMALGEPVDDQAGFREAG